MRVLLSFCFLLLACSAQCQDYRVTPAQPDPHRDSVVAAAVANKLGMVMDMGKDTVMLISTFMISRKELLTEMRNSDVLDRQTQDSVALLIPGADSMKKEYYQAFLCIAPPYNYAQGYYVQVCLDKQFEVACYAYRSLKLKTREKY